jgi:hypothetical protein
VILMIGAFGLSSISFNKYDQYAGEVFGKKVSFQEFRAFETLTRILPPSEQIASNPELEKQFTWQQLILAKEAKNKGFEVSDTEVRARVDLMVNPEGKTPISKEDYLQLLKSRRTTPNEFESGIREIIRIQKMISQQFSAPVTAPDSKKTEKETAEDIKKKQEEYVRWMTELLQRSKLIDYSKKNQDVVAQ